MNKAVIYKTNKLNQSVFCSAFNFLILAIVVLAVCAIVVESSHAPPAIVFLQPLHRHIPTTYLLTVFFPQKGHIYLEC